MTRDYVFDLDRMVSLQGDTSVHLQYAYARIQSMLRKAVGGADPGGRAPAPLPQPHPELELTPAERAFALHPDEFAGTLGSLAETYEPHKLAAYLYELATLYTTFFHQCPVLQAPDEAMVANRLFLCDLTARTLHKGMSLLGVRTPARL